MEENGPSERHIEGSQNIKGQDRINHEVVKHQVVNSHNIISTGRPLGLILLKIISSSVFDSHMYIFWIL